MFPKNHTTFAEKINFGDTKKESVS